MSPGRRPRDWRLSLRLEGLRGQSSRGGVTALCPLQAGHIAPRDSRARRQPGDRGLRWRLPVRNVPLQKHPPPHRHAGSRAPLAQRGAPCRGPSSSPLPSLTLSHVLQLLMPIHLPSDEPWGDRACWGLHCPLGTPPPSPPGCTAPRGGLALGCSIGEGMDEPPASPTCTDRGRRG